MAITRSVERERSLGSLSEPHKTNASTVSMLFICGNVATPTRDIGQVQVKPVLTIASLVLRDLIKNRSIFSNTLWESLLYSGTPPTAKYTHARARTHTHTHTR